MDNKCYRVVPPLQGVQLLNSFQDRIYTEVPADRPDHPSCFEGEWVCSHTLCPVRTVRLRVKAYYHKHLPRLRCPLCLRHLDFRHWLTTIELQEVVAELPAEKPCRPLAAKRGSQPRKRKPAPAADVAHLAGG
jgi:hypothetical protein